jgi:transcriptional regulator with GAF, ATPase, and Fis domain
VRWRLGPVYEQAANGVARWAYQKSWPVIAGVSALPAALGFLASRFASGSSVAPAVTVAAVVFTFANSVLNAARTAAPKVLKDDEAQWFVEVTEEGLAALFERLARMAGMRSTEERVEELAGLQAVAVLTAAKVVGPRHSRACLFLLQDDETNDPVLVWTESQGRADDSRGTFGPHTSAMQMVQQRKGEFQPDTWTVEGTSRDKSYRTYVSATIFAGEKIYGMISLDALEPGDLGEPHAAVLRVLAQALSAGYALCD